jgi:ribonucleoside-diphosphate reductase alpha chain
MYAYKKGLKGFTTFNPSGSMKGILEYNEPKERVKEESVPDVVQRHLAPERPAELPCDIHEVALDGKKYLVLVGKLHGSLYEIFVDDNSAGEVNVNHHKDGIIRKNGKGKYSLIIKNGEEKVVVENLAAAFDATYGVLARFVSMSLRHGTPLQFIVEQLQKSKHFMSFEKVVARVLKKYIKDGEMVQTGETCAECGGHLEFKEGCLTCTSCGWSKCS